MRLYEGDIQSFTELVMQNQMADILQQNHEKYFGWKVGKSELNSWINSLNFLKNATQFSELKGNKMALEYGLPYSSGRIDALFFGRNESNVDTVAIVELKQWSNENVADSDTEGLITVNYGKFLKTQPHPSVQVEGYHQYLKDFVSIFEESQSIELDACSYCHNYSKNDANCVLFLPKFKRYTEKYPLFSKEDAKELGRYLNRRLSRDSGIAVFNRFVNSAFRPSKRLLRHVGDMVDRRQIFTLIDDQIVAYKEILHKAKELSGDDKKAVIIVNGGPGTGKSVIALEVMGELLRQGKTVFHATGSSAFTNTLRSIVGKRAHHLFKFFFNFTRYRENEIDVLICDEAHRIRKDSANYGVPASFKSKTPQIEDLIRPAKLSIFFIDEYQVVRPTEIGSVKLIREAAVKLGVQKSEILEFDLKTQFRCSGSDAYLQWIENTLQVRESDKKFLTSEDAMEFKIFDDPKQLQAAISERNRENKNSARIVAGFCWPWSEPHLDGTLVSDVKIGDFSMPWERKGLFWKWATYDEGMEEVGTVYTSQGFEFDYIGVIFGNDLVYDPARGAWEGRAENSHDSSTKHNNKQFTEHMKRVYRVLLSRAHKGVYVYFMDKNTENYFRSKMEK